MTEAVVFDLASLVLPSLTELTADALAALT